MLDEFSLATLKINGIKGVKEMLSNPVGKLGPLTIEFIPSVKTESVNGKAVVCLQFSDNRDNPCYTETLWLDPQRGFLLVRRLRKFNLCQSRFRSTWDYVINDSKEVLKGVWMPTSATLIRYKGEIPDQKVEMRIDSIRPNISETVDTYDVRIEDGTEIRDDRSNP